MLRAVEADVAIEYLFFCSELIKTKESDHLFNRMVGERDPLLLEVDSSILESISYRKSSTGLLAIARSWDSNLGELHVPAKPLYLVASGIEKPGNLGAMFRSADAVSVDGVIFTDLVTDLFNANVIRSSLGTVFSVPSARTTNVLAVRWLKDHNVSICAASPDAEVSYDTFDFRLPSAVVIGGEAEGLSEFWRRAASTTLSLPQLGKSDSLNAAMCATVLLFEAHRQRLVDSRN